MKIRTRKNSVFEHFCRNDFQLIFSFHINIGGGVLILVFYVFSIRKYDFLSKLNQKRIHSNYIAIAWQFQEGLNKKEIQLNLYNIFSIFIFNELCFLLLMTLNRVKLGWAVTFSKYIVSVVSLIFLPKTFIWNKITFPTSNLLNFAEPMKNELVKSISKKI